MNSQTVSINPFVRRSVRNYAFIYLYQIIIGVLIFRLLDEEIKNEMNKVIMRVKKPVRPKSEVFLDQDDRSVLETT